MAAWKNRFLISIFLLGSFFLLFSMQRALETKLPKGASSEVVILPSPAIVKAVSMGNINLAADFYWLQLIQYFGFHHLTDKKYPYFYALSQQVTDLDPKFSFVYYFSAFILSYDLKKPELALQYLEKGNSHNPDDWLLLHQAGFVSYFYLKNSLLAADYYDKAAKVPGAPPQYADLAKLLRTKGLDTEKERFMWMQQYKNARDPVMKKRAEFALIKLQMKEDLDEINRALYRYRQQKGEYPENLNDLVDAGLLKNIPLDPLGRQYIYDRPVGLVKGEPVDEVRG